LERLNRFLARSGVSSRRGADELIAAGSVLVNGDRPPPSGVLIDPEKDTVTVDGRVVKPLTKHRYLMLNKPLGVITTAKDEASRSTVLDTIGEEGLAGHRLFPVGRLDGDTSGLLLLTDDGELAFRLTHPRYKVAKEYIAIVAGNLSASDAESLRNGVELDDGMTAPAEVEVVRFDAAPSAGAGRTEVRVVIREGRHLQARRMLHAVGHKVQSLRRTAFGPLRLGRLKTGDWRVLVEPEIEALRRAVRIERQ